MKYLKSIMKPRRGQALVETAVAFVVLLMVAMGLLQFALYMHARNVVTGSVQDGARVAASDNSSLDRGITHARSLLNTSMGSTASVSFSGYESQDEVTVSASGSMQPIVPFMFGLSLPLNASATVDKERFRPNELQGSRP